MKKRIILAVIAPLLLLACIDKFATQPENKLQAQLPDDAEITRDGTLLAEGRVVGISDGDTLTVLGSNQQRYKIRLQGIDAPEKEQAYGQKCKESLMMATANLPVTVEAYKLDRYGRIIAKITAQHKDVALEQIRAGCGWHYVAYAKEQNDKDRKAYALAEKQARKAHKGLWKDKKPMAPWDFRHQK